MKLVIKTVLLTSLLASPMVAKEVTKTKEPVKTAKVAKEITGQDIQIFTAKNSDGKITPKSIQDAFEKAGFFVSVNRDMNTPFKKQFKESSFSLYNLFTFYKKDVVLELAKKYENIGLFAPMSMSIYTKKGEKTISVATLSAEAIAKILNIPKDEKILTDLRALVIKTLQRALPEGKFEKLPYTPKEPKDKLVTTFTMDMDKDEWEDELDEFKMGFESELSPNGFIIAGHNNLGDDFEEAKYDGYDFYEVYSVCKLPVIYTIAKTRPEAGAFAPCSLYLAKKKGEAKMTTAFPSVYNWISSLAITDKKDLEVLENTQKRMTKILSELIE